MTDEELQELCAWLRTLSHPAVLQAADEIERLAAHVNALEHIINLDMYEATKTALVQAQDELERLAKENTNLWVIIRACQNDVLVAERERDEVLCRLKGTMQ